MNWISVKDKLPEDNNTYLCYFKGEQPDYWCYEGYAILEYDLKEKKWDNSDTEHFDMPVTHYMGLPKKPME